jgi:hypothetical protein
MTSPIVDIRGEAGFRREVPIEQYTSIFALPNVENQWASGLGPLNENLLILDLSLWKLFSLVCCLLYGFLINLSSFWDFQWAWGSQAT